MFLPGLLASLGLAMFMFVTNRFSKSRVGLAAGSVIRGPAYWLWGWLRT